MTACGLNEEWALDQLKQTRGRAAALRILYSVGFDLTHRCNQRCVHCYLGHRLARSADEAAELPTADVVRLLDEIVAAGCLNLVLSGGEPLLRPDFSEIYVAARSRGMLVQVFTNATLVNDEHIAAFTEYPPDKVDVSIYAASEETYRRVTGVKGAYGRAMRGIQRLLDAGVRVGLKTMILRENVDEVFELEALAAKLGTTFRVDPLVTPRLDGDLSPLEQRVDPEVATEIDMAVGVRREDLRAYLERVGTPEPSDRYYQCSAGATSCNIDPRGMMRPCFLSGEPAFSAVELGVEGAWSEVKALVDTLTLPEGSKCSTCDLRVICGYCPALLGLETGSAGRYSEYVCAIGAARHAQLAGSQ